MEAPPIFPLYMNIQHKLQLMPFPAPAVIMYSDQ